MNNENLKQFANQKYLNIESYRKSGQPVQTPVWFAEEGGLFYVYSLVDAGKVKRVRNNPEIKVAPCDMRGKTKGVWVAARARIGAEAEAKHGHRLLDQKYGLIKRIGNIFSKLRGKKHAVIIIEVL